MNTQYRNDIVNKFICKKGRTLIIDFDCKDEKKKGI